MAAGPPGFVTQFNPPKIVEEKTKLPLNLKNPKNISAVERNNQIPTALLDFQKNREQTRARARGLTNFDDFSSFENVMIRKGGASEQRKYEPAILNSFLGTEDGNFTLNTENGYQLITEQ